jgi:hypothetical protein
MPAMEQCLHALLSGGDTRDFSLTYNDMHGLWGGITIRLSGDGAYERTERPRGAHVPTMLHTTLDHERLSEALALLLELRAWEQHAPAQDRLPLPDESWATLEIRCGGATARFAERFNDLEAHQHLVRVRALLLALGGRRHELA